MSSPNTFLKLTDVKKDTTELMVRNLLKKNSTIQFKSINLVQKSDQTTVLLNFIHRRRPIKFVMKFRVKN